MIELLVVVCILGILVAVVVVSYSLFLNKARAVEGETVVREVDRREQIHHTQHQRYTVDLAELGFSTAGPLKYYTVDIRLGSAKSSIGYLAWAVPSGSTATDSWMLIAYRDGTTALDRVPQHPTGAPFANSNVVLESDGTVSLSTSGDDWDGVTGYASSPSRCQECGRTVFHRRAPK